MSKGSIRALALAIFVRPHDKAVLAIRMHDGGSVFYRPPGGGIEFGESSADAACREAQEELSQTAHAERLLGVVENRFVHDSGTGHEIVFNWLLQFEDESQYAREEFPVVESDGNRYVAHWVHDAELAAQGISLYPRDLVKQLEALG